MDLQFPRAVKVVFSNSLSSFDVANLRITFEIQKSLSMYSNLCQLKIYNLSYPTRAKIGAEYSHASVYTGYGEQMSLLFDGDIQNVFHRRDGGPDTVTICYCQDAGRVIQDTISSISRDGGTPFDPLFKGLIKDLGVPIGEIQINVPDVIGGGGYTFRGKTEDILNRLGDTYRFNWYIANGKFYAVGENQVLTRFPTIFISQTTGMVGSPTLTEIGMQVRTLLNPGLSPGARVTVQSVGTTVEFQNTYFYDIKQTIGDNQKGRAYKILRAVHTGDTRGNDWYTDIETQANWSSWSTNF